jgi:hypothetical protein
LKKDLTYRLFCELMWELKGRDEEAAGLIFDRYLGSLIERTWENRCGVEAVKREVKAILDAEQSPSPTRWRRAIPQFPTA